jgi:hypothetical protein
MLNEFISVLKYGKKHQITCDPVFHDKNRTLRFLPTEWKITCSCKKLSITLTDNEEAGQRIFQIISEHVTGRK